MSRGKECNTAGLHRKAMEGYTGNYIGRARRILLLGWGKKGKGGWQKTFRGDRSGTETGDIGGRRYCAHKSTGLSATWNWIQDSQLFLSLCCQQISVVMSSCHWMCGVHQRWQPTFAIVTLLFYLATKSWAMDLKVPAYVGINIIPHDC